MKKIFAVLGLACVVLLSGCERVAPNYAGVLMQNFGKQGKSDFSIQKGRVNTFSWGTGANELFQVPLWEQRADFEDRVLNLKAADNTAFTSKPVYSYKVIESRAVDVVFDNKHLDSSGEDFMRSLENEILETKIYDIMKEASRRYITDDLMANGGSLKLEKEVEELVRKEFDNRGLQLISFSSQLDFSDKVKAKIDNRNEVNTNITVLDQKILEQKKQNELEELVKQQNLIRSAGITKELLQQQVIEKWNGQLPIGSSGDTPLSLFVSAK
jgi:hypothetical protein